MEVGLFIDRPYARQRLSLSSRMTRARTITEMSDVKGLSAVVAYGPFEYIDLH